LRIAFVNATKKWGGVKTWCLDMGSALQRQGHAVWIYGRAGDFVERAQRRGLAARAVHFGPDFDPLLVARFLRCFARDRVDRVVVNVSKDLRTAGVAARLLGIPTIQHLGAPGDLCDTWKVRASQRLLRPRLLACSEFVRAELQRRVPLLGAADFASLHPGTELATAPASSHGAVRVLVSTSRLDADKGHRDLLDAAAALAAEAFDFHLVLVGSGTEEASLRAQARRLGLESRLTWAGFQSEVRPFLQAADVFVLPSLCEPLGIALQEAMAHGLVPVARRAGGVPEIWPPGLEALLVSPQAGANGLQQVLARVLRSSDEELQRWKQQTWEHAGRAFALDQQARRLAAWLAASGRP